MKCVTSKAWASNITRTCWKQPPHWPFLFIQWPTVGDIWVLILLVIPYSGLTENLGYAIQSLAVSGDCIKDLFTIDCREIFRSRNGNWLSYLTIMQPSPLVSQYQATIIHKSAPSPCSWKPLGKPWSLLSFQWRAYQPDCADPSRRSLLSVPAWSFHTTSWNMQWKIAGLW